MLITKKQTYLLLVPASFILLLLAVYPVLHVIFSAFSRVDAQSGSLVYAGLEHFSALLGDFFFQAAIKNTTVFMVVASVLQVMLGLLLALLFYRHFPGRRFLLPVIVYPMMLSTLVVSSIWRAWYHTEFGLINDVLQHFGIESVNWLGDADIALYAIIAVDTWQWVPMSFLIILAGLQSIPADLLEAAQIDGANSWQRFRYILLPLVMRPLMLALLLRSIDTFKLFDKVYVLTGGGPGAATETLSMFVYKYGFTFQDWGRASAAAVIMLVISLLMTVIYAVKVVKE